MDKIAVHVMFIHGENDKFVPTEMTIDKYNRTQAPKALYIAKEAEHAKSLIKNKAQYRQGIINFLHDVVKKLF